ncbi:DUF6084 family protein [Aeromicrobium sp.]
MSDLGLEITDVIAEPYAAAPQLTAKIHLTESTGAVVHALALRCQVRIEPQRRAYTEREDQGLADLFGPRERWSTTLKPFLWMQTGAMLPGFTGSCDIDLPLPCTYDFEVSGSKYLHALRDGSVSLEFLFSGTVFTQGSSGFAIDNVPWDRDVRYALPVRVWREMIDQYFPNSGWIRLDRDVLDALSHYRSARGLTSWEAAVTGLLGEAEEVVL